jgi:hypothetical protein
MTALGKQLGEEGLGCMLQLYLHSAATISQVAAFYAELLHGWLQCQAHHNISDSN